MFKNAFESCNPSFNCKSCSVNNQEQWKGQPLKWRVSRTKLVPTAPIHNFHSPIPTPTQPAFLFLCWSIEVTRFVNKRLVHYHSFWRLSEKLQGKWGWEGNWGKNKNLCCILVWKSSVYLTMERPVSMLCELLVTLVISCLQWDSILTPLELVSPAFCENDDWVGLRNIFPWHLFLFV